MSDLVGNPKDRLSHDAADNVFCSLTGREEVKNKILLVREGLAKLPPAHYQTLKYLVSHLVR